MTGYTVRLFARYAELLGANEVTLTLESDARVADLIAALRVRPGGELLPDSPFVAVNLTQVMASAVLRPGDAIAVLPPLAGG